MAMFGATRHPRARGRGALRTAAVAALGLAAVSAVGVRCFVAPSGSERGAPAGRRTALLGGVLAAAGGLAPQAAVALTPEELATVELFRRTSPSVLMVSDAADQPQKVSQTGAGRPKLQGTLGSGFAWDRNHVVTTASMMKGITRPQVTVLDRDGAGEERRTVLRGALVGVDPVTDVAVLWVDGDMRPLRRGSTEDLHVGQDVYALGNPFGFEHSLSKGVVAGVSRTLVSASGRPVGGVIQTDASINPGNSGGPLLDSAGQVIGVNNAILTSSGTFAGVGLAVPIEAIERSVTSVITKGHVQGPSMGVVLAHDALSQTLGIDGVMVRKVDRGSPAEIAGLRPMRGGRLGDIIVGIDSKRVDSIQTFFQALDGKLPGEQVLVSVRRAGEDVNTDDWVTLDIPVELGSRIL
uniref:PDZ domain-containing protein n=1 Tax=Alexandrium monilatum TaxID=311494 RepID=A0A7S4QRQ9_9DINO